MQGRSPGTLHYRPEGQNPNKRCHEVGLRAHGVVLIVQRVQLLHKAHLAKAQPPQCAELPLHAARLHTK